MYTVRYRTLLPSSGIILLLLKKLEARNLHNLITGISTQIWELSENLDLWTQIGWHSVISINLCCCWELSWFCQAGSWPPRTNSSITITGKEMAVKKVWFTKQLVSWKLYLLEALFTYLTVHFSGLKLYVDSSGGSSLVVFGGHNATIPCRFWYEPKLNTPREVRVKWTWQPAEGRETEVLVAAGSHARSSEKFRWFRTYVFGGCMIHF